MQISRPTNILFHLVFLILSLFAIVPMVFVVIISFSSQKSIAQYGYQFFPKSWSTEGYQFIFNAGSAILQSYGVSIVVTVVGVLIGITLISTYAYVLSRKNYPYRKFFTIAILIPMLFSGGIIANFLLVTSVLHLADTIWALILPMSVSPIYVFIMKSFFISSVPDAIIESAKIDGAGEFRTFLSIILPISKPGLATIALFLTLGYWNDWFNAMMYINNQDLVPIQYFLMRIENNLSVLQNMGGQAASSIVNDIPSESVQMAIAVLVVVPITFVYPFFQRYFTGGLTLGAIKG